MSTDPGASTSYSYSLTSPAWTDPSGSFTATLDAFDRQVALTDPIHGSSSFSWSYRADGQPASVAAPNGNTTTYGYDDAGSETSRTTTGTGGIARAAYAWTRNQAGQILTEASTISGDPANGTAAYGYEVAPLPWTDCRLVLKRILWLTRFAGLAVHGSRCHGSFRS